MKRERTSLSEGDPAWAGGREEVVADRSLAGGVAWIGCAKGLVLVLSWVSTLVVARLLTPRDYGVVGMAGLVLGVVAMVSEFGVGQAIVALSRLSDEQIEQVNGLAILLGLAGFGLACSGAARIAEFFDTPALAGVVVVLSTTLVVSSVRAVPLALLQKSFRFRDVALVDVGQACVAMTLSLAFAFLGLRYWALVLSAVGAAVSSAVWVLWLHRVRFAWPRMRFIREVLTFSAQAVIGRISWFVYSNADFAVVGKVLGQSALGAYSFAWTLANVPVEKITAVVGTVTPSFFAAAQDDRASLRRYLVTLTEALSLVTFPAALGLALVADDLVGVALGPQWSAAVVPLQALAAYASLRSVQPLLSQVLTIAGDIGFAARLGVLTAIMMPLGFYYGTHWGVNGVAMAWLLLYPLHFVACYVRVVQRIGCPARWLWDAVRPAVTGCCVMGLAVSSLARVGGDWSAAGRLAGSVVTGAAVYAGVVLLVHGERVGRVRRVLGELHG